MSISAKEVGTFIACAVAGFVIVHVGDRLIKGYKASKVKKQQVQSKPEVQESEVQQEPEKPMTRFEQLIKQTNAKNVRQKKTLDLMALTVTITTFKELKNGQYGHYSDEDGNNYLIYRQAPTRNWVLKETTEGNVVKFQMVSPAKLEELNGELGEEILQKFSEPKNFELWSSQDQEVKE